MHLQISGSISSVCWHSLYWPRKWVHEVIWQPEHFWTGWVDDALLCWLLAGDATSRPLVDPLVAEYSSPFSQTWHKAPLGEGIQVCSNGGSRPFPRGETYEIAKMYWQNFKNLLLKNHWANFNQTWHKAPLGEGIQVCSNEGPRPFPRGDNYEIAKICWWN